LADGGSRPYVDGGSRPFADGGSLPSPTGVASRQRRVEAGRGQGPAGAGLAFGVMAGTNVEAQIRAICLALPGVTERPSHGSPAFFAGKQFVMLWPDGHHDHTFPHLSCAAPPGAQEAHVAMAPEQFFRPPYVGSRGWLGVRLDAGVDRAEIEVICEDAFRCVAPKKLLAALDQEAERYQRG
jgi:hypothetical protein